MTPEQIEKALAFFEWLCEGVATIDDDNGDMQTVPKSIDRLADAVIDHKNAIYPFSPKDGGHDASGTYACSLVEAVGGVTAGLVKIADAIELLAHSVERSKK